MQSKGNGRSRQYVQSKRSSQRVLAFFLRRLALRLILRMRVKSSTCSTFFSTLHPAAVTRNMPNSTTIMPMKYSRALNLSILLVANSLWAPSQRLALSPSAGILSLMYFSTSSISSGSAECSRPRYILSLTFQPAFLSVSADISPQRGTTMGSESPWPIKMGMSLLGAGLGMNSLSFSWRSR
jgi:hypothetical protein